MSRALAMVRRRRRQSQQPDGRPDNPRSQVAHSYGLHGWRFFAVELVIVFLGVSGAALADDWRQQRQEREQSRLLVANLSKMMDQMIGHDRRVRSVYQARLDAFEAALARGERPAFVYMFRRGSRTVPTYGLDIVLAADGATLLHPDLMWQLGAYFGEVNGLAAQASRYLAFVEQHVLPYRERDEFFYEPGTNRLKPEYRENVERLRDMLTLEQRLARRAARLKAQLAR